MQVFSSLSDSSLVGLLQRGKIGIIPTDTVYGLVGSAADRSTVGRMFTVKSREHNPGTILAANIDQLVDLGLKRRYLQAVEHFWPNSISVIIPCGSDLEYLHMGLQSLAVRIPAHPELLQLLERTGPLMTTSANHPGEPTATNVHEAEASFGESVDFYVDDGELKNHLPSTIIRIVDDAIEIIREGAVKINEKGEIQ